MKDSLYIKSRLDNVRTELVPQYPEYTRIKNAKVATLEWIYNNGNIQPEDRIKNRLRNHEEEMKGFEFMNHQGLDVKEVEAKIKEIENILS